MNIEQRLRKIERMNRLMISGCLCLWVVLVAVAAAKKEPKDHGTIQAKRIEIVNDDGEVMVVLSHDGAGGSVDVFNGYGKQVASIQSDKTNTGRIMLGDREGRPRNGLAIDD